MYSDRHNSIYDNKNDNGDNNYNDNDYDNRSINDNYNDNNDNNGIILYYTILLDWNLVCRTEEL